MYQELVGAQSNTNSCRHKVKRKKSAKDRDVAMVGLLLLFCQGAKTSLLAGMAPY
jgi:hypothetical protein